MQPTQSALMSLKVDMVESMAPLMGVASVEPYSTLSAGGEGGGG